MAEVKSFPNNQDVYVGAEWVMKWLHGRTSGVFGADGNLATSIVPNSMSIEVSDGVGWLSNVNGDGVVFWNDSEQTSGDKLRLTHDVADSALDRIDRIVVSWKTTNYVDLPTISILKGVASSKPVAPQLTNNSTMRQISIAQIKIPAGTIALSPATLTDERLDESVCGIVTESVKIDTSMMQNQFIALLIAVQNELANILAGSGFDPSPIRFENVNVSPDVFYEFSPSNDEEAKIIELGYRYRASVNLSGVTESMFPNLTFSKYDVDVSGIDIVNQYNCFNGGVYLYADGIPSENIKILTAELRKPVGSVAPSYNGVLNLDLDENYSDSNVFAEVDGVNYGVKNAIGELASDNVYDFTVK